MLGVYVGLLVALCVLVPADRHPYWFWARVGTRRQMNRRFGAVQAEACIDTGSEVPDPEGLLDHFCRGYPDGRSTPQRKVALFPAMLQDCNSLGGLFLGMGR